MPTVSRQAATHLLAMRALVCLGVFFALAATPAGAKEEGQVVYLTDMSRCTPRPALGMDAEYWMRRR